jgi:hypothetical protein
MRVTSVGPRSLAHLVEVALYWIERRWGTDIAASTVAARYDGLILGHNRIFRDHIHSDMGRWRHIPESPFEKSCLLSFAPLPGRLPGSHLIISPPFGRLFQS